MKKKHKTSKLHGMIQAQELIKVPAWEYFPLLVFLRSLLYFIFLLTTILLHFSCSLLVFPLSIEKRYFFITLWSRYNIFVLRYLCGVRYQVIGKENITEQKGIIVANHQSIWETLALQKIFPRQTWILKKEILKLPFLGWGASMLKPIAIDRSAKRVAREQILQQGKESLESGAWILVFPEGTRVAPGGHKKYGKGAASLAVAAGAPMIPVAHNAGECWGRRKFAIKPGVITVKIGPAIMTQGRDVQAVHAETEAWIRQTLKTLPPAVR